jgi:hypothetical protein
LKQEVEEGGVEKKPKKAKLSVVSPPKEEEAEVENGRESPRELAREPLPDDVDVGVDDGDEDSDASIVPRGTGTQCRSCPYDGPNILRHFTAIHGWETKKCRKCGHFWDKCFYEGHPCKAFPAPEAFDEALKPRSVRVRRECRDRDEDSDEDEASETDVDQVTIL